MSGTAGIPHHVTFTPNGNRRGARKHHISYEESYVRGASRALDAAQWAKDAGVKHVTFFGLSCENIERRSSEEIDALQEGAIMFCDAAIDQGMHVHVFGKIDEFEHDPKYEKLYARLSRLRECHAGPDDFVIHVAANYSGEAKHELACLLDNLYTRGFAEVQRDPLRYMLSGSVPRVDLAIRTGGERRISGFLPFQSSYAELYFTETLWGDFDRGEFDAALSWFASQGRNFGK